MHPSHHTSRLIVAALLLAACCFNPYVHAPAAELTREHVTGPYEFVELDATHWLPETRPDECAAAIIRRVRASTHP